LASATQKELATELRPLGLTKRATTIAQLARRLSELESVPLEPESLQRLPGVGKYTAHAVPTFASGENLPLVDWVIARVLRRYFGRTQKRRPKADHELWELAATIVRPGRSREIWL